ncbi:MAG: sugar transferase [Clostridia bacterium]|nr:sugar transferase [Clostridia bacterium]
MPPTKPLTPLPADPDAAIAALEAALGRKRWQLPFKRGLDIVASALGLVALSPVFGAIALAIKLDDRGPVFYRQLRVGRGEKPFFILKFRTMAQGADRAGLPLTVGADSRITRVGHFLRRAKLDELAQLVNVLRGEMSLVGPRPEVPKYVALYTPLQRMVLRLRPGVTDPASIRYRNENDLLGAAADPERTYIETVMPAKLAINLAYLHTFSAWKDCGVLLSTVLHLGKDAVL